MVDLKQREQFFTELSALSKKSTIEMMRKCYDTLAPIATVDWQFVLDALESGFKDAMSEARIAEGRL